MRRHDLGDVKMYQLNFSDLSEMFSNKRGAFFIENFPIQTQQTNARKTLKPKLKEGKRNDFFTKTTYHVTTGLVFQYIANINPTPEKPCATQIYNVILMH